MSKILASLSALALIAAPIAASADESVRLLTSKSTGNLGTAVSDDIVIVDEAPVAGGGLGTAGAVALGIGGLLVAAALLDDSDDDDDDDTTTTTTTTAENGDD
ncbi:hypothetical protein JSE7799_03461 [Jannaschia seosinensis]|uniref:Uncharacterized protein n=1 Tax=Jannaschia seosinensis TaxID=313367 RepID=A0A0M7BH96_9RHOB|nr:hypothetical protein [Jannaschia seosinensis]CUH40726.1 hypothetical protein JSE7799_03461 [Jannaschia seosinensis]